MAKHGFAGGGATFSFAEWLDRLAGVYGVLMKKLLNPADSFRFSQQAFHSLRHPAFPGSGGRLHGP
jgi:hypothetical protein